MMSDFRDIAKVGGYRGLFRGFTPYLFNQLINDITVESKPKHWKAQKAQLLLFCADILLWNPLQILSTRLQNVDYQKTSLRQSLT